MSYQFVLARTEGNAGIVQLNRPDKLNALNSAIMSEVVDALRAFDRDPGVGCMVLTGNERAFAAGADIDQMATAGPIDMLNMSSISFWDQVRGISKPIVAAVSGYAFGGGCELAMSCDMIVASETAVFGQPEIKIGVIPGAGGTQRLTRAVGKALAMEMVLTGEPISAEKALAHGLVNRVVPKEVYLQEAVKLAQVIASRPPVAVRLGKESVNKTYEMTLTEGLAYERRMFYMLFATEDQKEGMKAFLEKRKPEWKGR